MKLRGANRVREMLSRMEDAGPAALAAGAADVAEAVRAGLGRPAGVEFVSEGLRAVVGSSGSAAVRQEIGTATVPPRPFLAPVAAAQGEAVAHGVAARVAAVLRG